MRNIKCIIWNTYVKPSRFSCFRFNLIICRFNLITLNSLNIQTLELLADNVDKVCAGCWRMGFLPCSQKCEMKTIVSKGWKWTGDELQASEDFFNDVEYFFKRWWFYIKAKQLMTEIYPDEVGSFKLPDRWFSAFCNRKSISLRRKTHASQKTPNHLRNSIANFQAKSLHVINAPTIRYGR